jgi:hypothetical protein
MHQKYLWSIIQGNISIMMAFKKMFFAIWSIFSIEYDVLESIHKDLCVLLSEQCLEC